MKVAARENRGLFVLVRTSNASAGEFQDLVADGRPLYRHVAEKARDSGLRVLEEHRDTAMSGRSSVRRTPGNSRSCAGCCRVFSSWCRVMVRKVVQRVMSPLRSMKMAWELSSIVPGR